MLLAEPSHRESWIWPGARFWWGCGWGSRLKRGDSGIQCPLCSLGSGDRCIFGCWKLSPASDVSPTPLRGDGPALTPVGLQGSCQEALP